MRKFVWIRMIWIGHQKKPFSLTVTVTNRKKPLLDGGLDNRRLG